MTTKTFRVRHGGHLGQELCRVMDEPMTADRVTIDDVRTEVEMAIRERLHVRLNVPQRPHDIYRQHLRWPEKIDGDAIVMRDSDCGLARPPERWTPARWREEVHGGAVLNLWRMVGMWDFERYDEPAAQAVRFCHQDPRAAGRELHRLREEVARLRSEKEQRR